MARKIHAAASEQSVVVIGAGTAAELVAELAGQLASVLARRAALEQDIEHAFFGLPEAAILVSLPGIGVRLGARIAIEIGSISRFRTPSHLASYAGLGPTPWRSGSSINTTAANHGGNHRLKNALFLAAFASLVIPRRGRTTTASAPKDGVIHRRCCASRDGASTCYTPCSATACRIDRR